jgi:predicted RNase H-like HicB family nuclease
MRHYIAVLCPHAEGGWRAHFPDFPGCKAHGHVIEKAIDAAAQSVGRHIAGLSRQNEKIPEPRSLEAIRSDETWARDRAIDWSRCVVSLVRPPASLPSE